MGYSAKILADSLSPDNVRLTTFEVTFPRIVLAEFNTHRVFTRNSASSRAIPVQKMLARVLEDPFLPVYWGRNQKGMQAEQELSITEIERAASIWLSARDSMVDHVNQLLEVGVHKQIANRLLEPFMYHTVIVTATEWANFFHLRAHKDAQPEIQKIARMMKELYEANTPKQLRYGEWHLPLLQPNECVIDRNSPEWDEPVGAERTIFDIETAKKVSAGRCARVSYLTHDGVRDSKADIELCEKLAEAGHMSPLEHVARPMRPSETLMFSNSMKDSTAMFGNFRGWMQFRKEFANEWDVLGGK